MGNSDSKNSTPRGPAAQQGERPKVLSRFGNLSACRGGALSEETFHAMLNRERRRAERSRKPVVLILVDSHAVCKSGSGTAHLERLTSVVSDATRETDIMGWYEEDLVLGVMFTEVNLDVKRPITEVLHSKVMAALRDKLDHRLVSNLVVSVHLIPESWDTHSSDRMADFKILQKHSQKTTKNRLPIIIKRGIDIVGSCLFLFVFSPLLAAIALAIKLGSEGQVIFEQERLGWFGTRFKCLKFRTMYTNSDSKIHRDYVQRLIAGDAAKENGSEAGAEPIVYKITSDPRVTPIGKFLRKTSLDEFPQFWNVLRGDMSLVGPRPALAYEFELYDDWHRRRVFEMKPGITGLWQVSGRSSVCFDDMVRLDLRYSQRWSLWLDLKILLATPRAALKGNGAY
jgi:lipopolysaccharide/colanic/teichoic acid biosynthesis glycosyltransferase